MTSAVLLPRLGILPEPILDVDFASWSAGFYDPAAFGAQPFIAPDKSLLRHARNYWSILGGKTENGETVQTSEATLLRSPLGTQTNVACVGRHRADRQYGLVIQPSDKNYAPDSYDNCTLNSPRELTAAAGYMLPKTCPGAGPAITGIPDIPDSPDQSHTGCSEVSVYTRLPDPLFWPGDPPDLDYPTQDSWNGAWNLVDQIGRSPGSILTGSGEACYSSWQRSGPRGIIHPVRALNRPTPMAMSWIDAGARIGQYGDSYGRWDHTIDYSTVSRQGSDTWGRLVMPSPAGRVRAVACVADAKSPDIDVGNYFDNWDEDWLAILPPGEPIPPKHLALRVRVDYIHCNTGVYPTEAIPSGLGERPSDKLRYANASHLRAANGQIKFYCRLTPKHASSMNTYAIYNNSGSVVGCWTFFRWGADHTNYARINTTTKKLHVRIASGAEAISANAVEFDQYDVLEFDIAVGNNLASVARYRRNLGAWIDLGLPTIADLPNPGAQEMTFFSNISQGDSSAGYQFVGDHYSWCAWVHRLAILK